MGSFSIWHWLIVLAVVVLLFGGRGKISQLMGDFGKGLKSFKKSMRDDDSSFEDQPATPAEPKALSSDSPRVGETAGTHDRATRS
jgi:sec-independent protein translocase protein TatA